jgi:hypothetical protein
MERRGRVISNRENTLGPEVRHLELCSRGLALIPRETPRSDVTWLLAVCPYFL